MGMFNVYNSLAMIAYGLDNKISVDAIRNTLKMMRGVPGRFERVYAGQKFGVYCDYAHTPNGLENILASAREICDGRLFCVFGCGGDRDRTKRPIMGAVVTRLADVAVVTQDNSRTEPPDRIIDQVVQGIEQEMARIEPSRQFKFVVEPDRFLAIKHAIQNASEGDVVIIAGKGAETYQIFKDRTIHFDDREVSMNILRELVSGAGNDA
jgi:UDP-N-acetylmuramoyl-L-alanyl-D-glutamate--2,6-diaminopimelate ligase